MNILVINTVGFQHNGITSVIMNYYRNMDRQDLQMDFVVANKLEYSFQKEFEENNSNVFYFSRKKNAIVYVKNLYTLLKNSKYDIVHIHGNSSLMILETLSALLAKVPVRIVHSHSTSCEHLMLHKFLFPFFSFSYTHALACSRDAGKWLFHSRAFRELKNGIDLEKYKYILSIRKEYREKLRVEDRVLIGYVGNFSEQKNHSFIIKVFYELLQKDTNYYLLLIGDGNLLEQSKLLAQELKINENICFLGKTMEVNCYLQAMDLFVLPSLCEGLPVVLIEAQAAGLPCIVSEMVSKEADITNSISFLPICNPSDWVVPILNMFGNTSIEVRQERRNIVCKKNQKMISEAGYNIKKSAKQLKTWYQEFIQN